MSCTNIGFGFIVTNLGRPAFELEEGRVLQSTRHG